MPVSQKANPGHSITNHLLARSQGATNKRSFGDDITNRISNEGKSINAQGGAAIIHPVLLHPLNSSQHAEVTSQDGDKANKTFDSMHQVSRLILTL